MRHWVHGSIGAALIAFGVGCSSGGGTAAGGGAATGGGADTAPDGGDSSGSACTVVARGLKVSEGRGTTPSIAWTGAGYAVVWQDLEADEGDIHLAILDEKGTRRSEEVIEDGVGISSHPHVHRSGDGLLVLWQDRYGAGSIVRGRHATLDGAPLGGAFNVAPSSSPDAWPIGAASQSGSMVTWMDTGRSLLGFLGSSALNATISVDQASFPSLAADGSQTALVWAKDGALGFARPRSGGAPLDTLSHDGVTAKLPRVALGGGAAFIAWEDTRTDDEQIRLLRISDHNDFSREAVVSRGDGSANWPALAWMGGRLAVAYYQFRDGPPSIFVTLLGSELEPMAVDLDVGGGAPARFPAAVWTGEELGVAYAENDHGVALSRVMCP
jgi:hypothetical protein